MIVLGLVPSTAAGVAARPGAPLSHDQGGQDIDDIRLQVVGGVDGFVAPGRPYPVTVTVTADRRVHGTVRVGVSAAGAWVTVERPFEIPGRSSRQIWFLAPPPPDGAVPRLVVQLEETGIPETRTESVNLRFDPDNELVGVLPDVMPHRSSATVSVELAIDDVGLARLAPVAPELLELGPLALEPFDQLVARPSDLGALSTGRRAAVTTWVERGGQLLVVSGGGLGVLPSAVDGDGGDGGVLPPAAAGDGGGSLDDILPAGWQLPQPGQPARAGLGQVRLVGERWADQLLPSPTRSADEEQLIASDLPGGPMSLPLGELARARLLAASGLGLLLAGYVVVVGPVVFVGLRALRRRQVAWAMVPAVALVATGGAFALGEVFRSPDASAQVTVYETGPGGTVATSWSLLTRNPVGEVAVELPAGWTTDGVTEWFAEGVHRGVVVEPHGRDQGASIASAGSPINGYGLVGASGPVAGMEDALVVTAWSEVDGQVVGTVRNRLDVQLEQVLALVNRVGLADLGTLDPGEERGFEIDGATTFRWGGPHPEEQVWPAGPVDGIMPGAVPAPDVGAGPDGVVLAPPAMRPEGAGSTGSDDVVVPAAWAEVLRQTGWNYRPPGQVVAVGWTDQLDSPVTPHRGTAGLARSPAAVVARGTVVASGDRLTDASVVRTLVRGPVTEDGRLDVADDGGADGLFAFSLPTEVDGRPVDRGRLVLGLPPWYEAAELWVGDRWVPLDVPDAEGGEIRIPPDAVVDGTVFVRAAIQPSPPVGGRNFVLYEQEAALWQATPPP
ncbi:MAG: hypothetical protein ACRD2C_16740 [Acidimicrobiales bacterium]